MDAGTRSFPGRSQREPAGRRRAPNRPAITTGTESAAPQCLSAQCSGKPIAKPRAMIRALTTARTRMIHIAAEGTAAPGTDHADSPVSRPNREEGDSELLVGRETVREQHRDESGGDDRAGKDDPHEPQGYRGTDRSPAPAVGARRASGRRHRHGDGPTTRAPGTAPEHSPRGRTIPRLRFTPGPRRVMDASRLCDAPAPYREDRDSTRTPLTARAESATESPSTSTGSRGIRRRHNPLLVACRGGAYGRARPAVFAGRARGAPPAGIEPAT